MVVRGLCVRCDIVCDAARFDFDCVCCLCVFVCVLLCFVYVCGVCEALGDVVWSVSGCVFCYVLCVSSYVCVLFLIYRVMFVWYVLCVVVFVRAVVECVCVLIAMSCVMLYGLRFVRDSLCGAVWRVVVFAWLLFLCGLCQCVLRRLCLMHSVTLSGVGVVFFVFVL